MLSTYFVAYPLLTTGRRRGGPRTGKPSLLWREAVAGGGQARQNRPTGSCYSFCSGCSNDLLLLRPDFPVHRLACFERGLFANVLY